MSIKSWVAGTVLAGAIAAPVRAAIISYSQDVVQCAQQSFWGPGGSAASTVEPAVGLRLAGGVVFGTAVPARCRGLTPVRSADYTDAVPMEGVWAGIFLRWQAGRQLQSIIGAKIDVTAHALRVMCASCARTMPLRRRSPPTRPSTMRHMPATPLPPRPLGWGLIFGSAVSRQGLIWISSKIYLPRWRCRACFRRPTGLAGWSARMFASTSMVHRSVCVL